MSLRDNMLRQEQNIGKIYRQKYLQFSRNVIIDKEKALIRNNKLLVPIREIRRYLFKFTQIIFMQYTISFTHPHRHFIDIECVIDNVKSSTLKVQLPAWRPGRYELGNFAKNIQFWEAFDTNNNKLKHKKTNKDTWEVETNGQSTIKIRYNYFANELNAGSTYLDEKQLYVNPVNCCLFVEERLNEECNLHLIIPSNYTVASGLENKDRKQLAKNEGFKEEIFTAANFHELADSPLIASDSLKHHELSVSGIIFNLWFQGDCTPDWHKLLNDFYIFIKEQMATMKNFPSKEYHFLFQILPTKFYHGVEHLNSTVIGLGPSYSVMQGNMYNELLGVSCHELFHSWNVKAVRPAEMTPYNYSKENYSRLGFVYEGVTTYYGDYFLFRSGVFSEEEYLKTFEERCNKHFHNPARHSMSVTDASFDTWLDGYVPGIPNRKTSIYDEGSLLAFITDILVRQETGNDYSLDDVMRLLYFDFSNKNTGYTDADYQKVIETITGKSFKTFFDQYVYGTHNYETLLRNCLDYIGYELTFALAPKLFEADYGFKLIEVNHALKVSAVFPNSPADKSTLAINDELVFVNDYPAKTDLNEWLKYFEYKKSTLTVISNGYKKTISLEADGNNYFPACKITKQTKLSAEQQHNFDLWAKRKV